MFSKKLIYILLIISNLSFANELEIIDAEKFVAKNPSSQRQEIISFITHQFDNKAVTQKDLDDLWNNLQVRNSQHLARFQIVNQKLYADSFNRFDLYFLKWVDYLQKIITKYKIEDIDFIIYVRDELIPDISFTDNLIKIPAFMMSKNITSIYEKDKLLLPDVHILMHNWAGLMERINKSKTDYTWDTKVNKIFWRGATTGSNDVNFYNIKNIDKLNRLKLTILSKLYPELLDARLNRFTELSKDQEGYNLKWIIEKLFGEDDFTVKEEDHLKYKYLVAIDGNTCPWMRVPWIMLSNSVLLKQETNNIQWFYPAIKPYVNYVPVKEDLTNIFDQLEWMKMNDNQVKEISINAQEFIKNELSPEDIEAHLVIILNKYHLIQKDKKIFATLKTLEEIRSVTFFLKGAYHRLKTKLLPWMDKWF